MITLQAVIAAEQAMIALYQAAVHSDLRPAAGSAAWKGCSPSTGSISASSWPGWSCPRERRPRRSPRAPRPRRSSITGPGRVTIAQLRAAERASATDLVRRLVTVPPALAQLFASIAASDATHVVALGGYGPGR